LAANFALATAPPSVRAARRQKASSGTPPAAAPGATSSPANSVFKALTGSSGGGGLGWLLPALLIAAFLGAGGMALLRHRAKSSDSNV
jgi:uncharacterized protein HemX